MNEWFLKTINKIRQIKLYPVVIILLSIIFLSLSVNHELIAKSQENDPYKLLYAVLNEVGISLFILGSITILLELSDFREYFHNRLIDILIRNEYISVLDASKLKDLEGRIQKVLYFKDQPNDKNSFFYKVQNNVKPLLDGCYYDNYEIRVDCKIEDDLIKKRITKRYEVVNPKPIRLEIKLPINALMRTIDNIDDKDLYIIEHISIKSSVTNREGLVVETDETIGIDIKYDRCNDEVINKYDLKVYTENTITVLDKCTIEITYSTITPLSDPHFSHRVSKPCKQYRCVFYFQNNSYDLSGFGFGFMDRSNKPFKNSFMGGVELLFKDWILPGDGVIFTILKK